MIGVTGAGGFIGSHVVAALRHGGHEVRSLLGPDDPERGEHTERLALGGRGTDTERLAAWARGCSTIVHLAGPPSVAASFADPVGTVEAHVGGTAAVIQAAQNGGTEHIVLISSAEVYGHQESQPVCEEATAAPRSPYAGAKVAAEALVGASARAGGPRATVLRPFSVYGPGQGRHSLLAELVAAAIRNESLSVRDPAPCRDYVWIDDVCAAVSAAVTRAPQQPEVFNVASGVGHSVGDVARLVAAVFELPDDIGVTGAARPADIAMLVGSTERAVRELGVGPPTRLHEGITRLRDGEVAA